MAELGEGVTVGPHAVIEAGAVVGDGTSVLANAIVTGHATIGAGCQIHYGAVIGHEPQDLAFEGAESRVILGDGCVVREYATVHRATREGGATVVGENCLLMVGSHVAHDCQIGRNVVICNSALVAGHAIVGDRAFLSGNAVVHQFSRVGRLVMLSGISGIGRDVGPFLTVACRSQVAGLNTVGMRRAGLSGTTRRLVRDAYRMLFKAETIDEGLAQIRERIEPDPAVKEILDFYSISGRGFARPATHRWLEFAAGAL